MTTIHHARPHTTTPARNGHPAATAESRSPDRRRRAKRVSHGVLASYLHDISARHTRAAPTGGVVAADEEKGRLTPASRL